MSHEVKDRLMCHSSHLQLVFGVVLVLHVTVDILHELSFRDPREAELSLGRRRGIEVGGHLARTVELEACSMFK